MLRIEIVMALTLKGGLDQTNSRHVTLENGVDGRCAQAMILADVVASTTIHLEVPGKSTSSCMLRANP